MGLQADGLFFTKFLTCLLYFRSQLRRDGQVIIINGNDGIELVFLRFIRENRSMLAALQKKDWKAFARLYNGPAYAQNRYDEKLSTAYSSFNK